MSYRLLHDWENNESSERHLKTNGKKFSKHCVAVLRLLYQGKRLNARQLETEYGIDGRRLRDCYANRKDIKKEWVRDSENKTVYMEYWMELPKQKTKSDLQKFWDELQEERGPAQIYQQTLF